VTDTAETLLVRRFAAPLEATDGRTIVGRAIPFDVEADVGDVTPSGVIGYREVWRPGAFRRVVRAPHRVLLTYEHREGLADAIGPAVELEERADGFYTAFRALPGLVGDQALELIRAEAVTGLSVLCVMHPRGTRRTDTGVVERTLVAALRHVALVAQPAYTDAQVTAVRSAVEGAPRPVLDEVRAWRAARGVPSAPSS
jgi:HK97 family phage prohead protease